MWSKLTFLTALALLTTAAQAAAGEVRKRWRGDLVAMVGEVAAVGRAEGAAVSADDVVGFFDAIPTGMKSSMQRDAATGRRLELDAIGGAVVRPAGTTSRYRSPAGTSTNCAPATPPEPAGQADRIAFLLSSLGQVAGPCAARL
jgi:hypothetical protein